MRRSVNYSRSSSKWQSTRPVTQIGPDSRPKLILWTLSASVWRVPWLWTQTGATTPQDDWHCTWWPCPAVTAAPRYCGSLPPGTALAYFPGEEDDKESWTQQKETTCVTAGIPWRAPWSPGQGPNAFPNGRAHPQGWQVLVIPLLSRCLQLSWETFLTKISLFSISVCGTKPRLHNQGSLCKCFIKGCLDTRGLSKYFLLIADRNAWKYFHTIFCLRKTWMHSLSQSRMLLIEDAPLMYCQRFGILRALGRSCFSGLKSSGKSWKVSVSFSHQQGKDDDMQLLTVSGGPQRCYT